jgi:hypothetical protein
MEELCSHLLPSSDKEIGKCKSKKYRHLSQITRKHSQERDGVLGKRSGEEYAS